MIRSWSLYCVHKAPISSSETLWTRRRCSRKFLAENFNLLRQILTLGHNAGVQAILPCNISIRIFQRFKEKLRGKKELRKYVDLNEHLKLLALMLKSFVSKDRKTSFPHSGVSLSIRALEFSVLKTNDKIVKTK